jgi:hypothetical protein
VSNVAGSTVSRTTHLSMKLVKGYSLQKFYTLHKFKIFTTFSLHVYTNMVEETAVFLLSWLRLLIYGPLYALVYAKWRVVLPDMLCCVSFVGITFSKFYRKNVLHVRRWNQQRLILNLTWSQLHMSRTRKKKAHLHPYLNKKKIDILCLPCKYCKQKRKPSCRTGSEVP